MDEKTQRCFHLEVLPVNLEPGDQSKKKSFTDHIDKN